MEKPEVFGKYLLIDRVSVGGMAEVFKAMTASISGFQKVLAIKRVLPHVSEDREFVQMFIDEANIAGQLHHANIVQIYDLGMIDDASFIAMEFVEGKDLRSIYDRVRKMRKPIPVDMAVYVATNVLAGLDYAHRKTDGTMSPLNIVHRDVSPPNVLISRDGEVKLIDFGIAKAAKKISKTQAGVLKGKFGYMSPEQVRGMPVDGRSDIFSVGIILHEMLCGRRLFVGDSDFATLEKVRGMEIDKPSSCNSRVSEDLDAVVMRALERDVKKRYATAMEMMHDLQRYLFSKPEIFSETQMTAWMQQTFEDEFEQSRKKMEEIEALDLNMLGIDLGSLEKAPVQSMRHSEIQPRDPDEIEEPMLPEREAEIVSADRKPEKEKDREIEIETGRLSGDVSQTDEIPSPHSRLIAILAILLVAVFALGMFAVGSVDDRTLTLENEGPTSVVVFHANQPDAIVRFKGKELCRTPCRVKKFSLGDHDVAIEKEGFLSDRVSFKLKKNETAQVLGELYKPGTVPAALILRTTPEGANVTIEGKDFKSPTPATFPGLKAGIPLNVKLKLEGYHEATTTVILERESTRIETVRLVPLTPTIRISSDPPGAKVYINGRNSKQLTPARLDELKDGETYSIRLVLEGYQSHSANATVVDGEEVVLEVELESKSRPVAQKNQAKPRNLGQLNVFTDPQAKIYIDGRFTGRYSPASGIKLKPGQHELKLINPEFNLHEITTITIKNGQTTRFNRRFKQD